MNTQKPMLDSSNAIARAKQQTLLAGPSASALLCYRFGNLYFEGQWKRGSAGYSAEVNSPWTSETIARIDVATPTDVDRAFVFAKQMQPAWAACAPSRKAEIFRSAVRVLKARRDEVVDWLVREAGSTQVKAHIEWWATHEALSEATTLLSHLSNRTHYGDDLAREELMYREPVGVTSVIGSRSWPLHLSMRAVAPALALGSAVVVEPTRETPISGGLLIAKIFEEADLPAGALSVVVGQTRKLADAFGPHSIPSVL